MRGRSRAGGLSAGPLGGCAPTITLEQPERFAGVPLDSLASIGVTERPGLRGYRHTSLVEVEVWGTT